ncbi:MAG: tetratricopeptide repeat protein [Terriglobales bacterium]
MKGNAYVSNRSAVPVAMLLLGAVLSCAQTFEVAPRSDASLGATSPARTRSAPQTAENDLGWGSGLEVAQQARAAQAALGAGEYAAASAHAERAARAAPQNADLWFLFGYAARLAGRYQASTDAFERGLAVRPASVQGLAGLAQTYAKMGRNEDARRLLLQVIAASPNSANELQLAGELFLSSDPQQALNLLQRAETHDPAPRTELLLARAYQMLNRPDEANQSLESARSRAPHDSDVLRAVAAYYRENRKYDLALSTLHNVTARTAEYWAELAYTYQLAGKTNEATDAYVQAANSAQGEIAYQLGAADALLNAGKIEATTELLRRAETLNADHYRLHAIRGRLATLQDRPDSAIQEYQTAIVHLPEAVPEGALYPVELHINLAELYRETENLAASAEQVSLAAAQLKNIEAGGAVSPEFLRLRAAIESASDDQSAAEKDLNQALSLDSGNVALILNYANLLWKMQRRDESLKVFHQALELDPGNRSALTSLGFLSRETDRAKEAEGYFLRLAELYPNDHVAYLALGDLYTSEKLFPLAQTNYQKAYSLAPTKPLIVARGSNAALEGHDLELAKRWLDLAEGEMKRDVQVMRERERYLTLTGHYGESAELGYQVLEKLPQDPEAPVYLGYDLVFLGQYEQALALFEQYEPILPRDKDLWLIAGHSHNSLGSPGKAVTDFTEALERDPTMATGYMDRGYVLNNLKKPDAASADFEMAIKLHPGYGEAYLGLSMAHLQLNRATKAMEEVNVAEKILGPSRITHLTRAEAFRQRLRLNDAEREYRAALIFAPNDTDVQIALADTIFRLRRYQEAVDLLLRVSAVEPGEALVYARLARVYAQLHSQQETLHYAQEAEKAGKGQSGILLATGEAFLTLGDRHAAMERFSRALEAQEGDVIDTRLAIARVFAIEGRAAEARQQVALGLAEARVSENTPLKPEHLVEAADIFLSTHEFELAEMYLRRALAEGADEDIVALRLANANLAEGRTKSAGAQLTAAAGQDGQTQSYDYLMTRANVYRQQQDNLPALVSFARANELAGDDKTAESAQYEVASEEGRRINDNVSLSSAATFAPIFEDITIYMLDAKLLNVSSPKQLPPPRSSFESRGEVDYRLHFDGVPTLTGFVGERNAEGTISIPSTSTIQNRNTYDTLFNVGISPTPRLGNAKIVLNTGVQFTIRRDSLSPVAMNQNLFRQFLYFSTNSLMNWLTVSGNVIHETGPFPEQNLHSRDFVASVAFKVGRPWGKASLITGYDLHDVLFRPSILEYYTTDAYLGLERRIGTRLQIAVLADYIRAWEVQGYDYAIAQAIRPAARFEYHRSAQWSVESSFALSRGQGFHTYNNTQTGFLVSYVKPLRGSLRDGGQDVAVSYPLRFSFGFQQQMFYNFSGHASAALLPVVRLSLF